MSFTVQSTVRDRDCDKHSPISKLVLDTMYKGGNVWSVGDLKSLADAGMLWCRSRTTGYSTTVRIFYSHKHSRWIATTRPDETVCDNLLYLPIRSETRGFAYCEL